MEVLVIPNASKISKLKILKDFLVAALLSNGRVRVLEVR
jgi:hypothetical protein